jgi:serine/threonine protein kinase
MIFPNSNKYIDSIFRGEYSFDIDIKPVLDDDRFPQIISQGSMAVVFKFEGAQNAYAVKCFTEDTKSAGADRLERYELIHKKIQELSSRYFTDFRFISKAIYCKIDKANDQNNYFPALLMNYVDGQLLKNYLIELCGRSDKKGLKKTAKKFLELAKFLLSRKIAHGDLKNDNIIVDNSGCLVLVDYDGMYIPEFEGKIQNEVGTPSYQHPERPNAPFNKNIDHFSILVIYLSILILAEDPSLFEKYNDVQNIIFTHEDFLNIESSEISKEIPRLKNKLIDTLFFVLVESLKGSDIAIPDLERILEGDVPEPQIYVEISPATIIEGDNIKIEWISKYAKTTVLNNDRVAPSGNKTIIATKNLTLDFVCSNSFKTRKQRYTLNVTKKPRIVAFHAQRSKIKEKEKAVFILNFENAETATLKINEQTYDVTAFREFTIDEVETSIKAELVLVGANSSGTVAATSEVKIIPPVVIELFETNVNYTIQTRPIMLKWSISNADAAYIMPGNIDCLKSSSIELVPASDTTYQLVACNDLFEEKRQIRVNVLNIQMPRIKLPDPPKLNIELIHSIESNSSLKSGVNAFHNLLDEKLMEELNMPKTRPSLKEKAIIKFKKLLKNVH